MLPFSLNAQSPISGIRRTAELNVTEAHADINVLKRNKLLTYMHVPQRMKTTTEKELPGSGLLSDDVKNIIW